MSTTKIVLLSIAAAVVVFLALAVFVLSPARSAAPSLKELNRVDHITYTTTARP